MWYPQMQEMLLLYTLTRGMPIQQSHQNPYEIYRSIEDIADIAKSCNNVTPEVCRLTDELMAAVNKTPQEVFSPDFSKQKQNSFQ